jgi:hypothetical protein
MQGASLRAFLNKSRTREAETSAPDFWSDQERAKRESQKLAELRHEYEK